MSNRKPAQLVTTLTLTALAASIPMATALAQTRAPSVSTGAATAVGYGSAELGGALNPHGATTTYYFQYRAHACLRPSDGARERGPNDGGRARERARHGARARHALPLPARGPQRRRRPHGRRPQPQDLRDPALAADPWRTQSHPLRVGRGDRGNPLGHGQREPRGRPPGEPLPLHAGLSRRRRTSSHDSDRRLRVPGPRAHAGHAVPGGDPGEPADREPGRDRAGRADRGDPRAPHAPPPPRADLRHRDAERGRDERRNPAPRPRGPCVASP